MGKREVKLFLFADDIILHLKNLKDSIRKLLPINTLSGVAGYKINAENPLAFLCIHSELTDKEIRVGGIPFTIVPQNT